MVELRSYNFELLAVLPRLRKMLSTGKMAMTQFDIWKQVGLAVGDIDNIQRHARMDRYVAQVTLSSPNVSTTSVPDILTQIEKEWLCLLPPLPPYNWKTSEKPSSLQKNVNRNPSTPLPPFNFSGKKGPFYLPLPHSFYPLRCKDLQKRGLLRRRSLDWSRWEIAWQAQLGGCLTRC